MLELILKNILHKFKASKNEYIYIYRVVRSLCAIKNSVYSKHLHKIDDLKMAITEYIRNMDRAILNTFFENTVRRVNKCLETGGGHFEHYL
jgi:hypothetical protein